MSEQDAEMDNARTDSYAAEQLAELQLLTRADHHDGMEREVPYSRLTLSIEDSSSDGLDDDADGAEEEDENEEISIESTGSSSFTALLAASRRLAGSGSSSSGCAASRSASGSASPPVLTLADSPRHAQASSTDARTRRPTTMPTLCEEQDAEEEEENEEGEKEEDEGEKITEHGPESPASVFEDEDNRKNQRRRIHGAQTRNVASRDTNPHARDARDEDTEDAEAEAEEEEDPVFTEMVHQLPYDLSFLALSVADVTVRNLERVRNALACSDSPGGEKLLQCGELRDVKPPLEKMRLVRTMMAVDTLRLFLLRCDEDDVLLAVTDAVRSIYAQYVHDHGVGPLCHAQGILTSSNITRVVLLVRDSLEKQQHQQQQQQSYTIHNDVNNNNNNSTETSSTNPFSFLRSGRPSPAKSSASSVSFSPSSWMSRRSSSSLSPGRGAPSPRHAASSSSVSSPGRTVSESSPRRACSILASEGTHVMMNEKIVAFQHRGDVNRLPSFKVRRDSAGNVEEAARRRQRSIQYGNEATRALRG